jgi:hypothetical protein
LASEAEEALYIDEVKKTEASEIIESSFSCFMAPQIFSGARWRFVDYGELSSEYL